MALWAIFFCDSKYVNSKPNDLEKLLLNLILYCRSYLGIQHDAKFHPKAFLKPTVSIDFIQLQPMLHHLIQLFGINHARPFVLKV